MKLSFWELDRYYRNIDVAIIGSGIVGLFAALEIKKSDPKKKVVVFEGGALPAGASTKNAGFACFGSPSELLHDLTVSGEQEVQKLIEKRIKGLKKLKKILGEKTIDYQGLGGYELFNNNLLFENCLNKMSYLNEMLYPITGNKQTYQLTDSRIVSFGYKNFDHMIFNAEEGQIDTGRMMQELMVLVQKMGVYILNSNRVKSLSANKPTFLLENEIEIEAKKILVCTNGFGKQLLPDLEVNPARAQVLITKPIKNLKIKGTFHFDEGYYYFRNIGNRVLFGGGRNLDFEGEATSEIQLSEKIQNQLNQLLKENILPNTVFEIDHRWSGIMGIGREKLPIVKKITEHVYCAVRLGGMGVAIGSLVGEEAAELLLNSN